MPGTSRLDWIVRQIEMGRRGHISIGEAQDSSKVKVKIMSEPAASGEISQSLRVAMEAKVQSVRKLVLGGVATDREHKHSSGRSIISI